MRCNVGVNPSFLTDAHLIAEYRELPIVIGSLKMNDWKIRSEVPSKFKLGKGHINFFKTKLIYLEFRHNEVKQEMIKRRFKCDALTISLSLYNIPVEYLSMWKPTLDDSMLIRSRIVQRLKAKPNNFWRFCGKKIDGGCLSKLCESLMFSNLYWV